MNTPFQTKHSPAPAELVARFVENARAIVRASELATSSQRAVAIRVLAQHTASEARR